MSNSAIHLTRAAIAASTCVLLLSVFADNATAGERGARARPAQARPNAALTRTTTVQRTDSGPTSHTTISGANGKTATRDVVVSNDREAGTRTRSVDATGPNGKTRSVDSVTQRTDDGYTRNTTAVGPKGNVTTRTVDVSCDKSAQGCTRTVEVNGGASGN